MKSLNRKHESQFCQKCQELGVNCCNFKAKQSVEEEEPVASVSSTAAATRKNKSTSGKSSSFKSGRPRKGRRSSVSSAEAAGESAGAAAAPEKKTVAQKKSSAPRRKPKTSVSSVEGDARQQQQKPSKNSVGKKSVPKPETGAGNQRRKPRVSFSSVEGEESEKKKKKPDKRRRRAPREENATTSEGEGEEVVAEVSGDEKTTTTKAPRRRRSAPKGRKASGGEERGAEDAEEIVAETANRVAKAAPRGGRSGVRGSAGRGGRGGAAAAADPPNKLRVHVYGEDDVLRHARTPKNSVAMDPGIREPKIREPKISAGAKKPRQRQQKRPSIGRGDAAPVTEAEVDALADKVAESVILSAERVIVEENNNNKNDNKEVDYDNNNNNNNKAPRQQKDENDNSIILEKPKAMGDVKGVVTAATAAPATYEAVAKETALVSSASSSPLKTATGEAAAGIAVELKGGHPPAVKVGGRRRVSSGRKSESEGKKPEMLAAAAQPEGGAEVEVAANDAAMADPENYQVQVVSKSKSVNHSEMSSVPEKPSPTKEVNRMPKVHPHHPTNKHPIQQPRKC